MANPDPSKVYPGGRFRRSRGIALPVLVVAIVSICIIFIQGGFSVGSSGFGRYWPSAQSEKVPLPPMKP